MRVVSKSVTVRRMTRSSRRPMHQELMRRASRNPAQKRASYKRKVKEQGGLACEEPWREMSPVPQVRMMLNVFCYGLQHIFSKSSRTCTKIGQLTGWSCTLDHYRFDHAHRFPFAASESCKKAHCLHTNVDTRERPTP